MEEAIISGRVQRSSRDLLKRFGAGGGPQPMEVDDGGGGEGLGEMELSLGLSLGGCFGVEQPKDKRLVRSSSISIFPAEQELFPVVSPLARTCSLPSETEEQLLRKRKELQSLKRLEAKRKRLEKRLGSSNYKLGPKNSIIDGAMDEDMDGGLRRGGSTVHLEDGIFHRGALPPLRVGAVRACSQIRDGSNSFPLASQGSIGSQGGVSSGFFDVDSLTKQGFNLPGLSNDNEVGSQSTTSLPEQSNIQGPAKAPPALRKPLTSAKEDHNRLKKSNTGRTNGVMKEAERSMMEAMPCVSTKGDGPDGIRIEGFLYKYRKGEEVRIVCFCHGSFLTPAEFVKHAGGGDVAHPLRHIVVSTSTPPFL